MRTCCWMRQETWWQMTLNSLWSSLPQSLLVKWTCRNGRSPRSVVKSRARTCAWRRRVGLGIESGCWGLWRRGESKFTPTCRKGERIWGTLGLQFHLKPWEGKGADLPVNNLQTHQAQEGDSLQAARVYEGETVLNQPDEMTALERGPLAKKTLTTAESYQPS